MENFGEELFMGDEFLDGDDNFLNGLSNTSKPHSSMVTASPDLGEAPPIGLSLKKSDSLVDLINCHLAQSQLKAVSIHTGK